MIFFDTTRSGTAGHASGLVRLNSRLRSELGASAAPGDWTEAAGAAGPGDWFLTTELFSEEERPGFGAFLRDRRFRAGRCVQRCDTAEAAPRHLAEERGPASRVPQASRRI